MLKPKLEKELFSSYSHLFGAIGSLIATIVLIILIDSGAMDRFVAGVFGVCAVLVFTFSAVYHFNKEKDDEISFWRKVDHSMIYLVIAGAFTPLCYMYLDGAMRIGILVGQWIFVVLGILFKIKFMDAPRWMSLGTFVLMGLMAVIPLNTLLEGLRASGNQVELFFWLAIGSISAGVLVYGTKKPDPKPGVFGFHDIWHILVIMALVFLFVVVFKIFV